MKNRIRIILIFLLAWSFAQTVCAQEIVNRNWDSGKIKGVRYVPYPSYQGMAFLSNTWLPGKIEFASGEIADSLFLRYSSFKDELIELLKEHSVDYNEDYLINYNLFNTLRG